MINLVMQIIDTNQVSKLDLKHQYYNKIYVITQIYNNIYILFLNELLLLRIQIMMQIVRNWLLKIMSHSLAAF